MTTCRLSEGVAGDVDVATRVEAILFTAKQETISESCFSLITILSERLSFVIDFLPRLFVTAFRTRVSAIEPLALLLHGVSATPRDDFVEFRTLPSLILSEVFRFPLSDTTHFATDMGSRFPCDMLFLLRCLDAGVYSREQVVDQIREYQLSHPRFDFDSLIHFAWFAPEIEELDAELLASLESSFQVTKQKFRLADAFEPFFSQKENLRYNNWEELKRRRQTGSEYSWAIANDDAERLRELLAKNQGTGNECVFPSIYERFGHISHSAVSLAQLASLFGSVNCFKFLVMQGAQIHVENKPKGVAAFGRFHSRSQRNELDFVIFGGSHEIVRYYHQNDCQFVGALNVAIEAHQTQLFHWIAEHFENPAEQLDSLIERAITSGSVEILVELLEQKSEKLSIKCDGNSLVSCVVNDFMKQK